MSKSLLKKLKRARKSTEFLWEVADFELCDNFEEEQAFEIAGGQRCKLIGCDGAGGRFFILPQNTNDENGPVLYVSSEGQAGIIAENLEKALQLMVALPYWRDCLKFSEGGNLSSMKEARKNMELSYKDEWTGLDARRKAVCKELGISEAKTALEDLHKIVTAPSEKLKVISSEDGNDYGDLLGGFSLKEPFYSCQSIKSFDRMTEPVKVLLSKYYSAEDGTDADESEQCEEEICASMNQADAECLLQELIVLLEEGEFANVQRMAVALRRTTSFDLSPLLERMIARGEIGHSYLYGGANSNIRDLLFAAIAGNPEDAICALAAIADEKVVAAFTAWRKEPPAWAEELTSRLELYTSHGNWTLDKSGKKRELTLRACIPLVADSVGAAPLTVFTDSLARCPWCEKQAVNFLIANFKDERLKVFSLKDLELKLMSCAQCCGLANWLYVSITSEKTARWSEHAIKPEDFVKCRQELPARRTLGLASAPRQPRYSGAFETMKGLSQIGGEPSWIQAPAFPSCPDCDEPMLFLAQVTRQDLFATDESDEGIYHAFICNLCFGQAVVSLQEPD